MNNDTHSSIYPENKILFPMIKVQETSEVYDPFETRDNYNVEWSGLSPLEMVAKLAYLVNSGFNVNQNRNILPDISPSSSSIPDDISTLFEDSYPNHHPTSYDDTRQKHCTKLKQDSSSALTKKRSRVELCENSTHEGKIIKCSSQRTDSTLPWLSDLSEIQRNDNLLSEHNELKSLTNIFQASPAYKHCYPSFERIQKYFCEEVVHLKKMHSKAENSTKAFLWHDLLYATNQKMNALIHMARHVEMNNDILFTRFNLSDQNNDKKTIHLKGKKSLSKKNFTKYMTAWLKENWTNPYPDDNELIQLSRDCGMTTREVSNWLINARTRKWRPSIVKAYKLGKSAAFLKEDAIRIFEGKQYLLTKKS